MWSEREVVLFEVGWMGLSDEFSYEQRPKWSKGVGREGCLEKRFRLRLKALRPGHCSVQGVSRSQCDSSEWARGECRSWRERGNGVWVMQAGGHARALGFHHVVGSHWKLWAVEWLVQICVLWRSFRLSCGRLTVGDKSGSREWNESYGSGPGQRWWTRLMVVGGDMQLISG